MVDSFDRPLAGGAYCYLFLRVGGSLTFREFYGLFRSRLHSRYPFRSPTGCLMDFNVLGRIAEGLLDAADGADLRNQFLVDPVLFFPEAYIFSTIFGVSLSVASTAVTP